MKSNTRNEQLLFSNNKSFMVEHVSGWTSSFSCQLCINPTYHISTIIINTKQICYLIFELFPKVLHAKNLDLLTAYEITKKFDVQPTLHFKNFIPFAPENRDERKWIIGVGKRINQKACTVKYFSISVWLASHWNYANKSRKKLLSGNAIDCVTLCLN